MTVNPSASLQGGHATHYAHDTLIKMIYIENDRTRQNRRLAARVTERESRACNIFVARSPNRAQRSRANDGRVKTNKKRAPNCFKVGDRLHGNRVCTCLSLRWATKLRFGQRARARAHLVQFQSAFWIVNFIFETLFLACFERSGEKTKKEKEKLQQF
jgi:hypothetical protein